MYSEAPFGQHVELVQEDDRDDDAGDEVDDQVEGVAVDPRHVVADLPRPRRRAVDAVEHHRDGKPQNGLAWLLVGHGDDAEHAADRPAGGDAVNEPSLGDGVTKSSYSCVPCVGHRQHSSWPGGFPASPSAGAIILTAFRELLGR